MAALPPDLQTWIDARKRHRLSDAEVQMARELGMNPKKLGKIDNHRQEPWKMPLKEFIAHLYFKRFGRPLPERVVSIEQRARELAAKKQAKKERKEVRPAAFASAPTVMYTDVMKPKDGWDQAKAGWERLGRANEKAHLDWLDALSVEESIRIFEDLSRGIPELDRPPVESPPPIVLSVIWKG